MTLQDKIIEILPKEKDFFADNTVVLSSGMVRFPPNPEMMMAYTVHNALLLEIKALIPKIIEMVREEDMQELMKYTWGHYDPIGCIKKLSDSGR